MVSKSNHCETAPPPAPAAQGWTVVEAKRGRKKTSDGAGTSVGSTKRTGNAGVKRQAADGDDEGGGKRRKKAEDLAVAGLPDFYKFQRKEAQRNAVAELQRRFEDDKKRLQQLKAARKFKPT